MNRIRLFVSALEPSSNLHLKSLVKVLGEKVSLCGVFDVAMGSPTYSVDEFSVMGFVDTFKKIPFFRKALRVLSVEASRSDKVLLMDSSSFNMRLAKAVRAMNPDMEIMYYILPQVWAWKEWRARELERVCNKLACIIPFETGYYSNSYVRYVGHPLLDIDLYSSNDGFYDGGSNVFVFMPGSRVSEIRHHMPEFRNLVSLIRESIPGSKFRLVVPSPFKGKSLGDLYGETSSFDVVYGTQDGLRGASFAFVCSGTATLETTLMRIPFLLVYKTSWVDFFILRSFVKIRYVGLANIFYQAMNGEMPGRGSLSLHAEIVQYGFSAQNMYDRFRNFDYLQYFVAADSVRAYLSNGSARNVASWLMED